MKLSIFPIQFGTVGRTNSTFIDIVKQKLVKDDENGPSWAIFLNKKTNYCVVLILSNPRLVS